MVLKFKTMINVIIKPVLALGGVFISGFEACFFHTLLYLLTKDTLKVTTAMSLKYAIGGCHFPYQMMQLRKGTTSY